MGEIPEKKKAEAEGPKGAARPYYIDFISPLGAFRAWEDVPHLEVAPNASEVWRDYNKELGQRAARLTVRIDRLLAKTGA